MGKGTLESQKERCGSAKRYRGVVLVVTVFVCSEGKKGAEEVASVKWDIENKKDNKVEK